MAFSLLVEETGVPGENHRPTASHRQTLSDNKESSAPLPQRESNSCLLLYAQLTASDYLFGIFKVTLTRLLLSTLQCKGDVFKYVLTASICGICLVTMASCSNTIDIVMIPLESYYL